MTPDDKYYATSVGAFSDYDRFEAFVPDIISLSAKGNYRYEYNQFVYFRLRLGPTLWINTAKNGGDTEMRLDYAGQIEYEYEPVSFIIGFSGRFSVGTPNLRYNEKDFHQFGIAGSVGIGSFRPGIHFRTPIDNNKYDLLDFVVGLNLVVQIP